MKQLFTEYKNKIKKIIDDLSFDDLFAFCYKAPSDRLPFSGVHRSAPMSNRRPVSAESSPVRSGQEIAMRTSCVVASIPPGLCRL